MWNPNNIRFLVVILLFSAVLVGIIDLLLVNAFKARYQKEQQEKADGVVQQATEQARQIEIDARDKALRILQEAEQKLVAAEQS